MKSMLLTGTIRHDQRAIAKVTSFCERVSVSEGDCRGRTVRYEIDSTSTMHRLLRPLPVFGNAALVP